MFTTRRSHFLFLCLIGPALTACNTTQEKKPDISAQTPRSETTQSSAQQQRTTTSQSAGQQETPQTNKTDDEILNDALDELERKKSEEQENAQVNEPATKAVPSTNTESQDSPTQTISNAPPPTGSLTSGEKTQQLDSKLDESFADFDALLLKEQERLTQEQNEQGDLSAPSGSGAASGGYGYEEGGGYDDEGNYDVASEEGEKQQSDGSNPFPSNTTQADIPPDLVSTKGDDVIARQLREAALKEKDPELREKLWDEYRKYKQGIGR